MGKISLPKVSPEELDRLLGVSKDIKGRSATTKTTVSKDTKGCSATTNDRSDTTNDRSATTKTESQRVNQWKKENRDTLRIDLPKGMKAQIQAEAKARGCSVTTLIQKAVAMYCSGTTDEKRSATTRDCSDTTT